MNKGSCSRLVRVLLFIIILSFAKHIKAHPHVFIDAKFELHFDDKGLSGVQVLWTFDSMFSEIMIDEFP